VGRLAGMEPRFTFALRRTAEAQRPARQRNTGKVIPSMAQTFVGQKRIRRMFGKIHEVLEMPNLIEVQKSSYDLFLRSGDSDTPLDDEGLMGTFQSVFPIKDFNETAVLEFVKYELDKPKYDIEECQTRDMTYSAPLKVTLRLIVFDVDPDTGARSVKDIKEQEVYMGDMPLMTPSGTFIVNGTERVVVSQMHRSPGVFFDHDKGKTHSSGKLLFQCRIIPYRGSWLDFDLAPGKLPKARHGFAFGALCQQHPAIHIDQRDGGNKNQLHPRPRGTVDGGRCPPSFGAHPAYLPQDEGVVMSDSRR
jgi:hypothetical protein